MTASANAPRDYAPLQDAMRALAGDRTLRMQNAADLLWNAFGGDGPRISWIGFYLAEQDRDQLVLGPNRNKPACSPISLHGACGQALTSRETLVIRDVASLGEGYIACDPEDRSELVIPLFDRNGCWGVVDADSYETNAFSHADAEAMHNLMHLARLTDRDAPPVRLI